MLLEGTADDIDQLRSRLAEFVASGMSELAIHDFASVSAGHPARLVAVRDGEASVAGFRWACVSAGFEDIEGKLRALVVARRGHQYFALAGSSVRLLVSAGEYGDEWWKNND